MEEQTNFYLDGDDKKPRRLLFIIGSVIIGILLITVVSCSILNSKSESNDNSLSTLSIEGNSISLSEAQEYDYNTVNESVSLKCVASNTKATVKGCNNVDNLVLNECTTKEITVVSESRKERKYKINICRYDSELPTITGIASNPETFTSGEVEVAVALDENVSFEGGMYSFDGGATWQKQNSIKVSENKTLSIMIKNKMGVTSNEKSYEVNNIDKTEPIVILNSNAPAGTATYNSIKLTATVTPSSTVSGYKYVWYLNNNEISNSNKSEYNATTSGSYKVKVITGAGKEAFSEEFKASIEKAPSASIVVSDSSVKNGSTITKNVTLTAKVENGSATKITWYENGKEVTTGNSYTVNASKTGKFEYKFTAQLSNGYTVTSQNFVLNVASQPQTSTVSLSVEAHINSENGVTYNSGTWTNKNVYITATARSSGSEIKSITFEGYKTFDTKSSATYSFTSAINKEITITAVDKLGTKATKKFVVRIDKTPPYTPFVSNSKQFVDYDCYKEGSSSRITIPGINYAINYDVICLASTNSSKYQFSTTDLDDGGSGINYCEIIYEEDDTPIYGSYGNYSWDFTDNKQKNKNDLNWVRDYNYNITTNPLLLRFAATYLRRCRDNAGNIGTTLVYLVYEKY